MLDLADYALTPTTTFELCDASGSVIELPGGMDETGIELTKRITFTVCHANEAEAQKFKMVQQQSNLTQLARQGRRIKLQAEELEEQATQFLAFCIKDWKNVVLRGQDLACTKENKVALLSDPKFYFIRKQVDDIVHDGSEFLGNSLKS